LWQDVGRKVAKWTSSDFPDVEEEDLFQDVMLYILNNDKLVDPKENWVVRGLNLYAKQRCWWYRKRALTISPQYAYRTSDIRRMLESGTLENSLYTELPADFETESFEDYVVASSDITCGFLRLSTNYQTQIFKRYILGEVPIGNTAEKRLSRAIERLTDIVNFYKFNIDHKGTGNRKAISNARAAKIIADQG
jgi:hypothetical protein